MKEFQSIFSVWTSPEVVALADWIPMKFRTYDKAVEYLQDVRAGVNPSTQIVGLRASALFRSQEGGK